MVGGDLGLAELVGEEIRQVFDIPEPRVVVTDPRVYKLRCSCGEVNEGEFPPDPRAPACYGSTASQRALPHGPPAPAHGESGRGNGGPVRSKHSTGLWTISTKRVLQGWTTSSTPAPPDMRFSVCALRRDADPCPGRPSTTSMSPAQGCSPCCTRI